MVASLASMARNTTVGWRQVPFCALVTNPTPYPTATKASIISSDPAYSAMIGSVPWLCRRRVICWLQPSRNWGSHTMSGYRMSSARGHEERPPADGPMGLPPTGGRSTWVRQRCRPCRRLKARCQRQSSHCAGHATAWKGTSRSCALLVPAPPLGNVQAVSTNGAQWHRPISRCAKCHD